MTTGSVSESVLLAIPARNEAPNLDAVIGELRATRPRDDILVVDDASRDETAAVARRLGCAVLALPFHMGYGGAIQSSIKYALRHAYPVVVTFDADGQHDPADIESLVAAVGAGADLVLGSRVATPDSYQGSLVRRMGRRFFSSLLWLVTGLRLADPTSGLKAFGPNGQALFCLGRFPDRFPDADALVLARRARLRIEERPVRMRPSRNRHSMHDGRAIAYTGNMILSLLVAAISRPSDLRR